MLIPLLLSHGLKSSLWPFDGGLAELLQSSDVVVTETYPAEFYHQLGLRMAKGGAKGAVDDRREDAPRLLALCDELGVVLTQDARAEVNTGFADDNAFDAFVGLLGMIRVIDGMQDPGPPPGIDAEARRVEGWILGQGHGTSSVARPSPPASGGPLQELATLLNARNRLDAEIARATGRPALAGHIGEFIASRVFDIDLEASATVAGIDGRFRSGPLAGRTVNVKVYGKGEGILDFPAVAPDFLLVFTGPHALAASSKDTTRPFVIEHAYLFETRVVVDRLRQAGVGIGVATSVRRSFWAEAALWPTPSPSASLTLSEAQCQQLQLFSARSGMAEGAAE